MESKTLFLFVLRPHLPEALHSEVTLGRLRGLYRMLQIRSGLALGKANALVVCYHSCRRKTFFLMFVFVFGSRLAVLGELLGCSI